MLFTLREEWTAKAFWTDENMHEIWKGSGGEEPLTVGGLATVPRKRTCIEELEVIDQPHLLTLFVDHIPHFLSQKRLGPPNGTGSCLRWASRATGSGLYLSQYLNVNVNNHIDNVTQCCYTTIHTFNYRFKDVTFGCKRRTHNLKVDGDQLKQTLDPFRPLQTPSEPSRPLQNPWS